MSPSQSLPQPRAARARGLASVTRRGRGAGALAVFACLLAPPVLPVATATPPRLPWSEAGLDEREAAAHLLDRLAFGARPGDVDRVLEVGLEAWVAQQLAAAAPERDLAARLAPYDALRMGAESIAETFPPPGVVLRRARRAETADSAEPGSASSAGNRSMAQPDAEPTAASGVAGGEEDAERRRRREAYEAMRAEGYRAQRELVGQLQAQKIVRAAYADNQLQEVLADFWFNHFHVSTADNQARAYVLSYERDAIRPHLLGSFRDLLGATARHPAMLHYLDNAQSRAEEGRRLALDVEQLRSRAASGDGSLGGRRGRRGGGGGFAGSARAARPAGGGAAQLAASQANRPRGLNENYARELLELHTLGVDGGYTQQDVIEVARAFTGWSVMPSRALRETGGPAAGLERLQRFGARAGFVTDESGFLFNPAWHDAEKKTALGSTLPAGRGLADGEQVLDLVAEHPATARHLARKLAIRFVADEPPAVLVDRLAATFRASGGDLTAVLRALVESEEFWASRGHKVKSPFELAVSAVRALDAEVEDPAALAQWIGRMGQPLYAYQAPTGYPDRAEFWVNTGALLNRMNFGLQLAAGRVRGVAVDLDALLGGHEPAAVDDALRRYAAVLLPERSLADALDRLEAMAHEPALVERVEERAAAAAMAGGASAMATGEAAAVEEPAAPASAASGGRGRRGRAERTAAVMSPQAQVVGVLLGSPEFQQR